ncbi:pilus assembly protein [Sphingomonas quercus]|uniref:Putative Flp pilus-assembly TadG-like N-terminal domain-containing protein n=1 Tax=Sphingomonas quercus TaxID=2842451 RepID=A0ABS6BHT3_9SPHN|nr:Tad domain-containing protein [Sphingomonas quercus]MBU3077865.1 hypothetical protein [Sphingomonas quercus]
MTRHHRPAAISSRRPAGAPAGWGALVRNERGAVLPIAVFAFLIILALLGSGLDLGRAYMAKSRLQQACDAGALGGRAELSLKEWAAGPHDSADGLFRENFPAGVYGSANLQFAYIATDDDNKKVTGTASADVPTTLMKIFGFRKISVSAECTAEVESNSVNNDFMFVLDVTSSMACPADKNVPCGATVQNTVNEEAPSDSRIKALKQAVLDFYKTVEAGKGQDTQTRYGFVPYAYNVNVGHLLKRDWVADRWTYQSRRPVGMLTPPPGEQVDYVTLSVTYTGTSDRLDWINEPVSGSEGGVNCAPPPFNTYTGGNPDKWQSEPQTYTGGDMTVHFPDGDYIIPAQRFIDNNIPVGMQFDVTFESTMSNPLNGYEYYDSGFNSDDKMCHYATITYNNRGVVEKYLRPYRARPMMYWLYSPLSYNISGLKVTDAQGNLVPYAQPLKVNISDWVSGPVQFFLTGELDGPWVPPSECATLICVVGGNMPVGCGGVTIFSVPFDVIPTRAPCTLPIADNPSSGVPFLGAESWAQTWHKAGSEPNLPDRSAGIFYQNFVFNFHRAFWNGCIQERATVPEYRGSNVLTGSSNVPDGGPYWDLDIDTVPNPANPATQWGMAIPSLIWTRGTDYNWKEPRMNSGSVYEYEERWYYSDNYYLTGNEWDIDGDLWGRKMIGLTACPTEARKLSAITESELAAYLDKLDGSDWSDPEDRARHYFKRNAGTYHSIGMIWGARLLSPTGLFKDENATAPNGKAIQRNIVFMTDGRIEINGMSYNAYGLEGLDLRRWAQREGVSGYDLGDDPLRGDGILHRVEEARFQIACTKAKAKGMKVWVIAFGTDLTPSLSQCATDTSHAFQADNVAELAQSFAQIAGSTGGLRITH